MGAGGGYSGGMKGNWRLSGWRGMVCVLLVVCWTGGAVWAQVEDSPEPPVVEAPAVEPELPATEPDEPAVEAPGEPEAPPPEAETPPEPPPPKRPPAYHGAEMRSAFKGAGSRFGVSGRVNKLPAKKSVKRDKEAWKGSASLGLSSAQGNRDTVRLDAAVSASKTTGQHYFFLKTTGRYGKSDKEKDAESVTLEGKAQRRLSERMYVALAGYGLHDQIADVSHRAYTSLSLGRHFVWTERTVLSAELGPGYVTERKGGETEGFAAGRVAQYLEFMVTPSLQVWESVEYLPSFEDSRIYFINAELGLETVLVGNLSLKCTLENRYDSYPAEGKEKNDFLVTTSLAWSF